MTGARLATDAQAIPAFARKYGFSCNVCHVPGFPKLNDTGNIFRDQGYQVDSELYHYLPAPPYTATINGTCSER